MEKTKKCSKCGETKKISEFYKEKRTKDGLHYWCKECDCKYQQSPKRKEQIKKYNQKPERKEQQRKFQKKYKKNPKRIKYLKIYNKKRKESSEYKIKSKNSSLKSNYGITLEEYNKLLIKQNYKCAICGRKTDKNLFVDHCHETNTVRGLLCIKCNSGLGMFNDSTDIMKNAIKYLNKYAITKKPKT